MVPEFIPKVEGAGDDSNFDEYEEEPMKVSTNDKFSREFQEW